MTQTETPHKTGDGSYNRESGKKTLTLVGIMLAVIVICVLLVLFLLFKG